MCFTIDNNAVMCANTYDSIDEKILGLSKLCVNPCLFKVNLLKTRHNWRQCFQNPQQWIYI